MDGRQKYCAIKTKRDHNGHILAGEWNHIEVLNRYPAEKLRTQLYILCNSNGSDAMTKMFILAVGKATTEKEEHTFR